MSAKFTRFWCLPRRRRSLLAEALAALALARISMAILPFRRIAAWLGTPGIETPLSADDSQVTTARDIGWAVACVARRVPWDGRCLAQAIAASAMLRRRGLQGTVNFGAERGGSKELIAHAWLRFGPCIVTGGQGHERFRLFTTVSRTSGFTHQSKNK